MAKPRLPQDTLALVQQILEVQDKQISELKRQLAEALAAQQAVGLSKPKRTRKHTAPGKKLRGIYEDPPGSGIHWFQYFDQNGKRHREKVGLRSAAIAVREQRKTEVRQGRFDPDHVKGKHRNVTVSELIDDFLLALEARGHRDLRNPKQRLAWWRRQYGDTSARAITPGDLEQARLKLARLRHQSKHKRQVGKPLSEATINRYFAAIKATFSWGLKNEKIEKNPFTKFQLNDEDNERVRYWTEDEEHRFFEAAAQEDHAMVLFALHTGMRKSEQLRTRWSDIDLQRRFIAVTTTKGRRIRTRHIPINDILCDLLKKIPCRIKNPYLFPGEKHGQPRTDLPRSWERSLQKAAIQDFHWHDLRHTFASRLVMKGADLYEVMRLLGHNNIETTKSYAHLFSNAPTRRCCSSKQERSVAIPTATTSASRPIGQCA
jgi:integrase